MVPRRNLFSCCRSILSARRAFPLSSRLCASLSRLTSPVLPGRGFGGRRTRSTGGGPGGSGIGAAFVTGGGSTGDEDPSGGAVGLYWLSVNETGGWVDERRG